MMLWDEILKNYNQRLDDLKSSLAYGSASDYSEYKQGVGQVIGIEWCRDVLKEIINKRIYEEEEE